MIEKFNNFNKINQYIGEGIDIDFKNRIVKINLNHENVVDTSIENNPNIINIDGIKVISFFKRKKLKDDNGDGNPLLYALKEINGWNISKFDIDLLYKQFLLIVSKINNQYDTIIKTPSNNELNNIFMDKLQKSIKCKNIIKNPFGKLEKDEVYLNCIDFTEMDDVDINRLNKSFSRMDTYFTFKHIPVDLRKYIKKIYNDNYIQDEIEDAIKINGKDILILDDTISSGSTISNMVKTIEKLYDPKSITVITLFSKL
jgi:hypothetical protein